MKKSKIDIIKSWYPLDFLSNEEAQVIYDNLLQLFLLLHKETPCNGMEDQNDV